MSVDLTHEAGVEQSYAAQRRFGNRPNAQQFLNNRPNSQQFLNNRPNSQRRPMQGARFRDLLDGLQRLASEQETVELLGLDEMDAHRQTPSTDDWTELSQKRLSLFMDSDNQPCLLAPDKDGTIFFKTYKGKGAAKGAQQLVTVGWGSSNELWLSVIMEESDEEMRAAMQQQGIQDLPWLNFFIRVPDADNVSTTMFFCCAGLFFLLVDYFAFQGVQRERLPNRLSLFEKILGRKRFPIKTVFAWYCLLQSCRVGRGLNRSTNSDLQAVAYEYGADENQWLKPFVTPVDAMVSLPETFMRDVDNAVVELKKAVFETVEEMKSGYVRPGGLQNATEALLVVADDIAQKIQLSSPPSNFTNLGLFAKMHMAGQGLVDTVATSLVILRRLERELSYLNVDLSCRRVEVRKQRADEPRMGDEVADVLKPVMAVARVPQIEQMFGNIVEGAKQHELWKLNQVANVCEIVDNLRNKVIEYHDGNLKAASLVFQMAQFADMFFLNPGKLSLLIALFIYTVEYKKHTVPVMQKMFAGVQSLTGNPWVKVLLQAMTSDKLSLFKLAPESAMVLIRLLAQHKMSTN